MVILSKIYTRSGDRGMTHLGDGKRTFKTDTRIKALSAVDEANSNVGLVLAYNTDDAIARVLNRVQNDLFDVGADLCTPLINGEDKLRVIESQIQYLENKIDLFNESLNTLKSFVLPTGTPAAAQAHIARTVARRAEIAIWDAIEEHDANINHLTARYLNRLSDLLFVIARYLNKDNNTLWIPGEYR